MSAIRLACKATRFPDACQASLTSRVLHDSNPTPVEVIGSALNVSAQNLNKGQAMVQQILESSAHNPNRSRAAQTCLEVLGLSEARTSQADDAMSRGNLRDARAWASAALCYQYDCWSGKI